MIDRDFLAKIAPYIDKTKRGDWLERGLVDDAPKEAVEAFEEYRKLMEWAKKNHKKV
jgi:hypothetical protein